MPGRWWPLGTLVVTLVLLLAIVLLLAHAVGCERMIYGQIICEAGATPILPPV